RKLYEVFGARWKFAVMVAHDSLRAAMEIAGARVIAKTGPEAENVIERGGSECGDIRIGRKKPRIIRRNGRYRRLVEHDLRQPDSIGIGGLARFAPPRQVPAMAVIPCEQCQGRVFHSRQVSGKWSRLSIMQRSKGHVPSSMSRRLPVAERLHNEVRK